VTTELTIEVEPDFLVAWSTDIYTLVEHEVTVAVTAKWRMAQRAKFDNWGQVSHEEWPELVDYTVDTVFVDGAEVELTSLHQDIQDTITNSHGLFEAIARRGAK